MSQQDPVNPYEAPASYNTVAPSPANQYAACPACGVRDATRMSFTWWGGVLGPKIINHVKCNHCRKTFNGKTGKSNLNAIALYVIVMLGLSLSLVFVIFAVLLTLVFG